MEESSQRKETIVTIQTIPLFQVLRDEGIAERAIPKHIADALGYNSAIYVRQVLFMGKYISLDQKQKWADALGLDLEVAFPEEIERPRYVPPMEVSEEHAQLAARIMAIANNFRAIQEELEGDEAAQIILGQSSNDKGLLEFLMERMIPIRQIANDIERILRTLGVDVDAVYKKMKEERL